jgi:hypothetical protein
MLVARISIRMHISGAHYTARLFFQRVVRGGSATTSKLFVVDWLQHLTPGQQRFDVSIARLNVGSHSSWSGSFNVEVQSII